MYGVPNKAWQVWGLINLKSVMTWHKLLAVVTVLCQLDVFVRQTRQRRELCVPRRTFYGYIVETLKYNIGHLFFEKSISGSANKKDTGYIIHILILSPRAIQSFHIISCTSCKLHPWMKSRLPTKWGESKLLTDNASITIFPKIVTDSPPCTIQAQLHSSIKMNSSSSL